MKTIMEIRKEYESGKFLMFSSLERIKIMHNLMIEIISIKAKTEGVTEHEIYRRYLNNNPGHYQKVSG